MAVFKDKQNRDWVLAITVLDVRNLRENMSPPIHLMDSESLGKIFDDEANQYEVMWRLVAPQAATYNVSEIEFASIFTENFAAATKAFLEALTNFFQQIGRVDLKELTLKILDASTKLRSVVEKNLLSPKFSKVLDGIVQDEDDRIQKELDAYLNKPSTTTPPSGSSPESSV